MVQHPLANDDATRSRQDEPNLCSEQPDSAISKAIKGLALAESQVNQCFYLCRGLDS